MSYKAAVRKLTELGRLEATGNHIAFDLLSKEELQVLQVAITDGLIEHGRLDSYTALSVDVERYAKQFGITKEKAAAEIAVALDDLFEASFAFVSKCGNFTKSRYIASFSSVKGEPVFSLTLAHAVTEKLMLDLSELKKKVGEDSKVLVSLSVNTGACLPRISKYLTSTFASSLYWFFIEKLCMGQSKFEVGFEQLISELNIDGDYPTAYDLKVQIVDDALREIGDLTDIAVTCKITPKVKADRLQFKIKELEQKKLSFK